MGLVLSNLIRQRAILNDIWGIREYILKIGMSDTDMCRMCNSRGETLKITQMTHDVITCMDLEKE